MSGVRTRIEELLTPFVNVRAAEDGDTATFGFDYGPVPFALQVVELSDGLDVVSVTGVLGWDLLLDAGLRSRVAHAADALQFGSVHLMERNTEADAVLRYSFPATGLDDAPLTTMLLLILEGAVTARADVTGTDTGA